jgi:hypothetical protein
MTAKSVALPHRMPNESGFQPSFLDASPRPGTAELLPGREPNGTKHRPCGPPGQHPGPGASALALAEHIGCVLTSWRAGLESTAKRRALPTIGQRLLLGHLTDHQIR